MIKQFSYKLDSVLRVEDQSTLYYDFELSKLFVYFTKGIRLLSWLQSENRYTSFNNA
jgi:hypothetical protein